MTQYELRTSRGARCFAYDTLPRAREEKARAERKIGIPLRLFEVTLVEREIPDTPPATASH